MLKDLTEVDWENTLGNLDSTEEKWKYFKDILQNSINNHIPKRSKPSLIKNKLTSLDNSIIRKIKKNTGPGRDILRPKMVRNI